jgi:hypothetical protein
LVSMRVRSRGTPSDSSASAVDADTVSTRLWRWTHGMTRCSRKRPAVLSGGRNRSDHKSVCTWLTTQIVGLRDHSGVRSRMPLQTSTTTSHWRSGLQ